MNLEDSLSEIEATTAALRRAIAAGDQSACQALLLRRDTALGVLGAALAAIGPSERAGLASRLNALAEADQELQCDANAAMERIAAEDRTRFGQDSRSPSQADREPQNVCLDRRA